MNALKSIALIGLRGSGKTSLGKLLAEKLEYVFFDTDEIFFQLEKQSIADFVAKNDWDAFREKEEQILWRMPPNKAIISCGGGIILRERNRQFLQQTVFTVFLDVPVNVLVARLQKDANTAQRPAFTSKSLAEEMQELSKARRALYLDACQYHLTQYADMAEEMQLILEQYQNRR